VVDSRRVAHDETVDVVIPVYNAPAATRACIESLYAHAGHRLGSVYVHDNASGPETARMLDALSLPRLRVHHAPVNTGFGDAVNQGVRQACTDAVLVLNSDVEAADDFVAPLQRALVSDAELAALTPSGNSFESYDLARYTKRGDCIVTHNLYAYAFLIRRAAFLEVGGFDPCFGLGYYEDTDLSRKLITAGYWLGVHPHSRLQHAIHGSFEGVPKFRELMANNRRLYFDRYPNARRRILLISRCARAGDLTETARRALDAVAEAGAEILWMASESPAEIPAMSVRGERFILLRAVRTLIRRRKKAFGRFTDLWVIDDAPARVKVVAWVARLLRLETRRFEAQRAHTPPRTVSTGAAVKLPSGDGAG